MQEVLALAILAASLAAAIGRPRWAPDWLVAVAGAALLIATGCATLHQAGSAVRQLGPTVGFLAALLVLADGCRRAGLFDALGGAMAAGSRGRPRRLLAMVFLVAASTTAVLSLDATVVLLTPIVFVTAARLRAGPRPHVLACAHLANSASLLLPVSNLTNLLAFRASGLSFLRFAELMVFPWVLAIAAEWVILRRSFAADLSGRLADEPPAAAAPVPRFAVVVVAAALAGFGLSSPLGVNPAWIAAAAAGALAVRERAPAGAIVRAAQPAFLVFVLALGVIVASAGNHGLSSAVVSIIPRGSGLGALLGVAAVSAVLCNVVNNLPATLILLPVVAQAGAGATLAMLVGVNVGPNLTYVGSLATLLWRRVLHAHDAPVELGEFTRLGVISVPVVTLVATVALWISLRVV